MRWARSFGVSRASRSANCSASASSLDWEPSTTPSSPWIQRALNSLEEASNLTVRDLARFGELMRLDGRYNGQQIVPKTVIDDIRKGGDRALFAPAGYKTLPGWSYRNMWWISHNDHAAFTARGIHGQAIYIDPAAEMVIVRFASSPLAGNVNLDPTSLPAYDAVARHLMGSRR